MAVVGALVGVREGVAVRGSRVSVVVDATRVAVAAGDDVVGDGGTFATRVEVSVGAGVKCGIASDAAQPTSHVKTM